MKRSVVTQIFDRCKRMGAVEFLQWLAENSGDLIEQERAQIAEAWREGNREGWGMTSDDPTDGEHYYNETFNAPERI